MRNGPILANDVRRSVSEAAPGIFSRLRYSPFLAQLVIIRRCNLSCSYCSEYDKVSDPIAAEILEKRLRKLKSLGTFGISLTGGEPTLHPQLPSLIRMCRELGFFRTGMISNGFLLRPELIEALNEAGLQEMQISIDGVEANDATQKVLANLKKRLQWLNEYARFRVIVSGVLGACPPREAEEVLSFARQLAATYTPHALLQYAMRVNGLWRNVCALGIFDSGIWETIDTAWEVLLLALGMATGNLDKVVGESVSSS